VKRLSPVRLVRCARPYAFVEDGQALVCDQRLESLEIAGVAKVCR
jgi:hypothetical protein